MNMKRLILTVILLSFLVTPFLSWAHPSSKKEKGKKYPSVYRSHIIIDGKANEWPDSLFFLNPDAKIRYAVVNDSNNLYLCFKVFDDGQQMKMLRGGMEVWIDPAGKKSQQCGILFPLSTTLNPGGKMGMHSDDPNAVKQAKLMFILQAKDMELKGFRNEVNGMFSNIAGRSGVKAVLKLDSTNILIYEAVIPFTDFKADLFVSNPLSVGFIIKGLERPKQQDGEDARGSDMEGHEGGGGIGEGYGGSGHHRHDGSPNEGSGPGNSHQAIFEDTPMWLKLTIAH
jgi:hypothetical protein